MTRSQLTLAGTGFEKYTKVTRRAEFLAEMDRVVPWRDLCARIEPVYPKAGNGRPPVPRRHLSRGEDGERKATMSRFINSVTGMLALRGVLPPELWEVCVRDK